MARAGAESPEAACAGRRPCEAEPVPVGPPGALVPGRRDEASCPERSVGAGACRVGWRVRGEADMCRDPLPRWAEMCVGLHASKCDMRSYFAKSETLRGSVRGRASYLERNAAAFPKLNVRESRLGRC